MRNSKIFHFVGQTLGFSSPKLNIWKILYFLAWCLFFSTQQKKQKSAYRTTNSSVFYDIDFTDFASMYSGLYSDYLAYEFTFLHTQLIVMITLAGVLYGLSKILSKKIFNLSKKSAYECGFEPFLILTTFIEIGFILVAFIFLIFDLELIFLSAFVVAAGSIGSFGILLLLFYVLTVWIMVFLEINTGVLSWPVWNTYKVKVQYKKKKNKYKLNTISWRNYTALRHMSLFGYYGSRATRLELDMFYWSTFKPFFKPYSLSGYLGTFFYKFSVDFEDSSFCWEIEDIAFFRKRKKLFGSFVS